MANKAYKFRIYPNDEQKVFFNKCFGCVRFIYNKILEDKIAYYKSCKQMLRNTPASYKSKYVWLKEVDSLALSNAQLNLQRAFTNFFNQPKVGFPKFKSKHKNRKSYTTNNQKGSITLENNLLKLPKVSGLIKVKQHRVIPKYCKIKSATISMTPSGKYYASILCEYESSISEIKPKTFIGLDYSMHELYVDSNGNIPKYPRYYRNSEKKLKREQRRLSLMQKGSANRQKQRLKVARLHEKIANQRRDFIHKATRQIANAYDCVCIESLNMQSMSKSLHFGKSVHDNGWGMFTEILKYKLEDLGKKLIKVDKFFASSQLCSCCGYKNPATKDLSLREWECPICGTYHDRDTNAAINIRAEGMRLLSSNS